MYAPSKVSELVVKSRIVSQTFVMKVFTPVSRTDGSERFPVLYATDCEYLFDGIANSAKILQDHGEIPRVILVCIGYGSASAANLLRMRDLYTHEQRNFLIEAIKSLSRAPLIGGVDNLSVITETTDAHQFHEFIRRELMPAVDKKFPTLPGENAYFGYSAGATFGIRTLFCEPDTFKKYVLGSPGTCYGGRNFAIEMAQRYLTAFDRIDAGVFLSVGELEEFKRGTGLVSGCAQLARFILDAGIRGLDFEARIFPGETHATAWSPAFNHGLKSVMGPAENVPFWP